MAENRKRRSRSRSWRRKLERKAGESALLFIMLNKPGFRYTVLAILFAFLCAGFYVAPIWNIAPEGYDRKVKSSLYQIREAKKFRENAAAAMQADDYGEAAYLLRVALMKDSVNPTLYRMVITNSMSHEALEPSDIRDVTLKTEKLLMLTENDPEDLDLVLAFLDQQGLHEHAIYTLLAKENLTPNQAKRLLELLFDAERYETFREVRNQYSSQLQDVFPGANAYEHAVNALMKETIDLAREDVQSLQSLEAQGQDISPLCRSLLLQVFRHFEQPKEYETVFKAVKKNKEDQPVQHADYWNLLMSAKQPRKAVYEAAQFWPFLVHHRFNRLEKAIRIAHAYEQVGLPKKAFELMDQIQSRFEDEAEYWMGYGDLLLKTEDWLEATALAVKLRSQRAGIKLLRPYAYYLEGISQGRLNRRPSAANAFSELIKLSPLDNEKTILNMARGMLEVGQGSKALEFLQIHDAALEDRLTYAQLLYQSAREAGNAILLAESDQSLVELKPDLPGTAVRRLETAVLALQDTESALQSFLEKQSETDLNDSEKLLVSCAYMQQEHFDQAGRLIEDIDLSALSQRESAMYHFIHFEWLVRTEQILEAKKHLALVNRQELFPSQVARLEALELQITTPDPTLFDQ